MPDAPSGATKGSPDVAETTKIDRLMDTLAAHKAEWAALPVPAKLALLKEVKARVLDQPLAWATASAQQVKKEAGEEAVAQELVATVVLVTLAIDGYIASLTTYQKTGAFPAPPMRQAPSGQTVAKVFPWGFKESKLNPLGAAGVQAELYLRPGCAATQGEFYRSGSKEGRVCVALGAGNQQFLSLLDALHQLFVEGTVVALKYHPIQAPVAPYIDHVLAPLARRGFFGSVLCGVEATKHLVYHPLADCVCMTGGTATHDAIVWGPREEQEGRKARNDPLLKVPITSELGCVTPWLVVPGPWTEAELTHHAKALAQAVLNNCSCNCLAAKVILLADGWDQGDAFIGKVKQELASYPLPNPYYPGMRDRYAAFKERYPTAEPVAGRPADPSQPCGEVLPTLVNVLDRFPANGKEEYAFQVEPFAPIVTFAKVPCQPGPGKSLEEAYLQEAVRTANEDIWGTLSCSLIVHPETERQHAAAVQAALDALRYGSVVLNSWSLVGYLVMPGHWGAFQGDQTLQDVGSGIGGVHNTYLFDHPEKTVVRTPFTSGIHPMPPNTSKLPLSVAKVVAGLSHSGLLGALRMALKSA